MDYPLQISCACNEPGNYSFFWNKASAGSLRLLEVGLFNESCQPFGTFNSVLYDWACSEDGATFNLTIRRASVNNNGETWRCQARSSKGTAIATTTTEVHCKFVYYYLSQNNYKKYYVICNGNVK